MSSSIANGSEELNSTLAAFFEALAKRIRLLIALGVLVLIFAVFLVVRASRKAAQNGAGSSALYYARQAVNTQLEALAKAEAAPVKAAKGKKATKTAAVTADAIMFKHFDVDTQLSDGVTKLKSVASTFASTHAGFEAMLILGQLYLNHGQPAEAAHWFNQSTQHASTTMDRALSWENLGYADENQGKYKAAFTAFNQALSFGEDTLKGDLLLAKARAAASMNDTKQAKAIYNQIESQLPDTEYAKLADLYQARIK